MLYVDPVSQNHMAIAERGATAGSTREKQALQEYERLFLFQMLKAMRKSVLKSELFGGESQKEIYQDMLDDVWAGEMAKSGQLGVADVIARQLEAQESQAKLATERRAARAAADFQGIPLHPTASMGLPIRSDSVEGLPVDRSGEAYFESPRMRRGIALDESDLLSETTSLPINTTTGPNAPRIGAGGQLK